MTVLDNLDTAITDGIVKYDSVHGADKILLTGTQTIVNNGNTTSTGTNSDYYTSKITTTTISNPLGIACLVRFAWSVDGTNFQSEDSHLLFSYTVTFTDIPVTSPPLPGLQAAVSMGVSNSSITILTGNGYHGNVSRTSGAGATGYTPTSQTFTINYALFSVT